MTTNNSNPLTKYQVDHLFLLIDENPLPNYVAGRLLLKQAGIVYLVHTTGTAKAAERLEKILSNEGTTVQPTSLNDYESDAYHIRETICSKLKDIKHGKIGLNYTGGTKAMAVHAYRTIFNNKQDPETVFSYLDPRKLEMCIDREDDQGIRIKIKPELLQVRLETLFQLHGLQLKENPTQEPQLPQLAATLAQIFNENKSKEWFDWWHNSFCPKTRKKKKNGEFDWENKTTLATLSISLKKLPLEIEAEFKRENLLDSDGKLSLKIVKEKGVFTEIKHFCKYLDGLWLEHHVLQKIKNIADQNFIKDYGLNFKVPLSRTKEGFEFDVAFTRGYQLFALSISTTFSRI